MAENSEGRNLLERVSLPVEAQLWRAIVGYSGMAEVIQKPNFRAVLIGTDNRFSLGKAILVENPRAKIMVVEKDAKAIALAKTNLSADNQVNFVNGFFPGVDLGIEKADLVIAKHLLHLPGVPRKKIVDEATRLAPVFFASTPKLPFIGRLLPNSAEEVLFPGGKLFVFKKPQTAR